MENTFFVFGFIEWICGEISLGKGLVGNMGHDRMN